MSDDPFVAHRSLLFSVAYEMLGSAADAEDVVQETWLRWAHIGDAARDEVRDPRASPSRSSRATTTPSSPCCERGSPSRLSTWQRSPGASLLLLRPIAEPLPSPPGRVARAGGKETSVQVDGARPTMFVGSIASGPHDDQGIVYLTANPDQLLIIRLLAPDFKDLGGYAYLRRPDIPKERLDAIDRLVAATRRRKREQN